MAQPAPRDTFVEYVLEQLGSLGEVTVRPMMGGRILYCGGFVFALLARGALFFKVDDGNRPMFIARGLPAFQPDETKPGTMSYHLIPEDVLENRAELARWATESLAASQRAATRRRAPRKRKVTEG